MIIYFIEVKKVKEDVVLAHPLHSELITQKYSYTILLLLVK